MTSGPGGDEESISGADETADGTDSRLMLPAVDSSAQRSTSMAKTPLKTSTGLQNPVSYGTSPSATPIRYARPLCRDAWLSSIVSRTEPRAGSGPTLSLPRIFPAGPGGFPR
jgi:hypothetical protein